MPTRTFTLPNRPFPLAPEFQTTAAFNAGTYQLTLSGTLSWDDVAGTRTVVSVAIDVDCEDTTLDLPFLRFFRDYTPTTSGTVTAPFSKQFQFVLPARRTLTLMVLEQPPMRQDGDAPPQRLYGPSVVNLVAGQAVLVS